MSRDLRDALSANARNKAFFSLSPEDAHSLARHTLPELSEHDLSAARAAPGISRPGGTVRSWPLLVLARSGRGRSLVRVGRHRAEDRLRAGLPAADIWPSLHLDSHGDRAGPHAPRRRRRPGQRGHQTGHGVVFPATSAFCVRFASLWLGQG